MIGREWQLGTVQVDYNLPIRFDLTYSGADNQPHRPVMIHRAPFGSMERFCGVLIEHFGGRFPRVALARAGAPRADQREDARLRPGAPVQAEGRPASAPRSTSTTTSSGAKIRRAEIEKVPYTLVLGAKEAEANSVSVRSRARGDEGVVPVDQFLAKVQEEIRQRSLSEKKKP